MQQIGLTIMLDDRGLTSLQTTANYGNFADSTFSQRIQKWLAGQRTKVADSCVCRDKNQYRLFFTDGYGVYVTMDGKKVRGIMPVLFPDIVRSMWTAEKNDGTEVMFFGASDGFVYQMERGTSFDGDAIDHFLYLVFNPSRSPRIKKHYRALELEIQGETYAAFSVGHQLGYGSEITVQREPQEISQGFSVSMWDVFTWDNFMWDGNSLAPARMKLGGRAVNISLMFTGSSDYIDSFTVSGALLDYSMGRGRR